MRFTTVRANIDLSEVTVNTRTGDFNPSSLAHVVNTDTVNELIVRTWLDKAGTQRVDRLVPSVLITVTSRSQVHPGVLREPLSCLEGDRSLPCCRRGCTLHPFGDSCSGAQGTGGSIPGWRISRAGQLR